MGGIGLGPIGLPTEPDDPADGLGPDGSPREISVDLDIQDTFAGWAQVPLGFFAPGADLDCASFGVLCTDDGAQPPDGDFVIGAMRTAETIQFDVDRGGQVALIFDRVGYRNSPDDSGGYSGADLVVVADLSGTGSLFMLEWKPGGWQIAPRRGSEARIVVDGASVLFVVPTLRGEEPKVRFLTFERIPPTEPGAGRMDMAPRIDSFFDVFYDLEVFTPG